MKLTDTAIRNARASEHPRKLFDGDGLYLVLSAVSTDRRNTLAKSLGWRLEV